MGIGYTVFFRVVTCHILYVGSVIRSHRFYSLFSASPNTARFCCFPLHFHYLHHFQVVVSSAYSTMMRSFVHYSVFCCGCGCRRCSAAAAAAVALLLLTWPPPPAPPRLLLWDDDVLLSDCSCGIILSHYCLLEIPNCNRYLYQKKCHHLLSSSSYSLLFCSILQ